MAGHYIIHSCPLLEVTSRSFCVSPMEDVLPRQLVQASSIGELSGHMDAYEQSLKATGKPYYVSVTKHPRCTARKISGFDKARDKGGALAARMGNTEALEQKVA